MLKILLYFLPLLFLFFWLPDAQAGHVPCCSSTNYCSGGIQFCQVCWSWQGHCQQETWNCGSCQGAQIPPTPTPTAPPPSCTPSCESNCSNGVRTCVNSECVTYNEPCCKVTRSDINCGPCSQTCGGYKVCYNNCGEQVTNACPACQGSTQTTQQCTSSGWQNISSTCVRNCSTPAPTPRPRCNQGRSCGACGVQCGQGQQECRYTRDENGNACDAAAGTEPCSSICPPGNSCVANACVLTGDPWIQSLGGSMRIDRGFTSRVPATALSGPYASLPGSGGTPGLIFTGDATANFGSGQPSQQPYSWVVGGTTFPNLYAPIRQGGIVKTSYIFLQAKLRQTNLTTTDLSSICSLSNCTLPPTLPSGIYISNGNLTLNSATFLAGTNYVFLISGNLRIQGRINVPVGATATFSASNDIMVDRNVGETLVSSTTSTIEGVFSADRNFTVEGINDCTQGTDIRLNVGGHVIANAALSGGTFTNFRNLCVSNRLYPTIYFKERPDFVLNTPEFLKQPNYTYQELAP